MHSLRHLVEESTLVQECALVFVPLLLGVVDSLGQVSSYLQPKSLLLALQSC